MAPTRVIRRLPEYESLDLLPLATRDPGTYIEETLIEGNSILSTVFVSSADPGSSLLVEYYDSTTGESEGEIYPLDSHPLLISGPQVSRITVTKIHNKPKMRATVLGGSVRFSVYLTVVSSFASDLDSALKFNEEIVDTGRDKGIPIVTWDQSLDIWRFLTSTNGRLQVDVPSGIQAVQQQINFRRYNQSLGLAAGVPTVHVDYTVPTGKRLFWLGGNGAADLWCKWTVDVDGVRWHTGRNSFDHPQVPLHLNSSTVFVAGQRIIVTVENVSRIEASANDVETFFFGALEDV